MLFLGDGWGDRVRVRRVVRLRLMRWRWMFGSRFRVFVYKKVRSRCKMNSITSVHSTVALPQLCYLETHIVVSSSLSSHPVKDYFQIVQFDNTYPLKMKSTILASASLLALASAQSGIPTVTIRTVPCASAPDQSFQSFSLAVNAVGVTKIGTSLPTSLFLSSLPYPSLPTHPCPANYQVTNSPQPQNPSAASP